MCSDIDAFCRWMNRQKLIYFVLGHDTTTSAISWILYELAKHPHYQKACQDEVDGVVKDNPGFVTWFVTDLFSFYNDFVLQCYAIVIIFKKVFDYNHLHPSCGLCYYL